MPNIVVEGVDGSGKTTLMDQLRVAGASSKKYFVMLRHSCRPYTFADAMRFYDVLRAANHSLTMLIDRHPMISEPIYGPILRKHNLLRVYNEAQILEMIERTTDVLIYCRPPDNIIRDGLKSQPQLVGVSDHIKQLIADYDLLIKHIRTQTRVRVIEYNWMQEGAFDYLKKELFGE